MFEKQVRKFSGRFNALALTQETPSQEEIAATGTKNGPIPAIPAFTFQVFRNVVLRGLNHGCLIYEHYKSEFAAGWH
jgi:hypothetical protein